MDFVQRMIGYFVRLQRKLKRHRRIVVTAACAVVFATTYALILPAVTLDEDTASETPGVSIEQNADEENNGAAAEVAPEEDAAEPEAEAVPDQTATDDNADDPAYIIEPTTLDYQGDGFRASADVNAGAMLPAGTTLQVKEITENSDADTYQNYYNSALAKFQETTPDINSLSNARFFDVNFLDANGNEVEPASDVTVNMSYDQPASVDTADGVKVIHFDSKTDDASVLGNDKTNIDAPNNQMDKVSFTSNSFSVYGIVEVPSLETHVISDDGSGYSFTVEYDSDSGIPDGSILQASEVTGDDYQSYLNKTNSLIYGDGTEGSVSFARYFDVKIMHDGQEIEPTKPVKVTAKVDGSDQITGDVNVLHFKGDNDEETIPADRQSDGTIAYEESSFSVVGFYEVPQLVANGMGSIVLASDSESSAPTHSKTLHSNGDGTYNLSLSVTGRSNSVTTSNKADVVVVFDTSGSMGWPGDNYSPTGQYGYWGRFYQLYKRSGSQRTGYTYTPITNEEQYTGDVYYYPSEGSDIRPFDRDRFRYTSDQGSTERRLSIAQKAINGLAEQLLGNNNGNTDANSANVTLSLVTFSNIANTQVDKTADLSQFQNAVNATRSNGYTNWQDALSKANGITTRDGADKYIIFVSDGNPSVYGSNGQTYTGGDGFETHANNVSMCYEQAVAELANVGTANFYGVGVFGNVDRMKALVTAAGSDASSHYQSATDRDSLNAAFANIIKSITNSSTFRNVSMTDNLTSLTSTGLSYTGDSAIAGISGFTYQKNGQTWTDAPQATYDPKTKQVKWDLGNTTVENGVTYSVTFKVWPSQEAMDLVAELNNGQIAYNRLTEEQKAMISDKDADGNYGLRTNTQSGNQISYTAVDTVKDETGTHETLTPGASDFTNPDPIPVAQSQMTVKKDWWPDGVNPPSGNVVLTVSGYPDGKTVDVTLNSTNEWQDKVYVAPGLKVGDNTLESGHDYTVSEANVPSGFTFTAGDAVHPMLANSPTNVTNTDGSALSTLTGTNMLIGLNVALLKTDTGNSSKTLPGAEFKLYKGSDGTSQVLTDATGAAIGTNGTITTDDEGKASLGKLAVGTYYLVETKAPDGYNLATQPIEIKVEGNDVTYKQADNSSSTSSPVTADSNGVFTLTITNSSGIALPSTGGNGTAPFAIAGAALITTAIVGFALRRRSEGRGE